MQSGSGPIGTASNYIYNVKITLFKIDINIKEYIIIYIERIDCTVFFFFLNYFSHYQLFTIHIYYMYNTI